MLKKTLNVIALFLIAAMPIITVLHRYKSTEKITVERGIGFWASMFIFIALVVFASFVINNFKAMIFKKPFGTLAIGTYGFTVSLIFLGVYVFIRSIKNAVESNLMEFVASANYHANTVLAMAIFAIIGLVIMILVKLTELKGL